MDALDLLLHRQSHHELISPAPHGEVLTTILKAGLKVPDHGKLSPYHFTVINKASMPQLEKLLFKAIEELDLLPSREEKASKICATAPMIVVVATQLNQADNKIPHWEKMITAGCAAYAIQLAARALGFDSFWFTGEWVNAPVLKKAFCTNGVGDVIAFIEIGTQEYPDEVCQEKVLTDFVSYL